MKALDRTRSCRKSETATMSRIEGVMIQMGNSADKEVYEATMIITVFGIFFTLMFSRLTAEFEPSRLLPMLASVFLSFTTIAAYVLASFLVILEYLYSAYKGELRQTWEKKRKFWHFSPRLGLRTLAVGFAPLGLFYLVAFLLYGAYPFAFREATLNYNWISLVYFAIWITSWVIEFLSRRDRKR